MFISGGYDFSQLFHASLVAFSPGSTFLATAHLNRIIIRSTTTLAIVRTFQCLSPTEPSKTPVDIVVDQVLWSSDSLYIIAFSSKASTGWMFGLTQEGNGEGGEVARLGGEGVEGLVRVEWGRGERDVIAWSDYGLRLTIYDLLTGETRCIQYPKSSQNCHTYSPDSRHLAVVERHSGKDYIGLYDVLNDYALLRHFQIQLHDVQEISWSPCGRYIAASEGPVTYALHLYSPLGPCLASFIPSSPSFSPKSTPEDPGLGIRCSAWAPGGRWIALGSWDGKVRIIEIDGGRCIAVMSWPARTVEKETAVWSEPRDWLRDTRGHGIVQFDRAKTPASLPHARPDMSHFPPRAGIVQIAFDSDASLFLVRLETQPLLVHVHSFLPSAQSPSPEITHLAVLLFSEPVRSAKWCSNQRKLAVTTRSGGVYFWDGDGGWVDDTGTDDKSVEMRGGMMEAVGVPTRVEFKSSDAIWSPDGSCIAILDKSSAQFCLLYEDQPSPPEQREQATPQRRWEGGGELSHVLEDEEADASVLSGLAEAEALWTQGRTRILV